MRWTTVLKCLTSPPASTPNCGLRFRSGRSLARAVVDVSLEIMKIITYETENGQVLQETKAALIQIFTDTKHDQTLDFVEPDEGLKRKLATWNGSESILVLFAEHMVDASETRMLISATDSEVFKEHCLLEAGNVKWGCCLGGEVIAVEYAPYLFRKYVQLHEALHLFGADECYNEETTITKPSCDTDSCVMRYEPKSIKVCSVVKKQLNG